MDRTDDFSNNSGKIENANKYSLERIKRLYYKYRRNKKIKFTFALPPEQYLYIYERSVMTGLSMPDIIRMMIVEDWRITRLVRDKYIQQEIEKRLGRGQDSSQSDKQGNKDTGDTGDNRDNGDNGDNVGNISDIVKEVAEAVDNAERKSSTQERAIEIVMERLRRGIKRNSGTSKKRIKNLKLLSDLGLLSDTIFAGYEDEIKRIYDSIENPDNSIDMKVKHKIENIMRKEDINE